MTRPGLARKAGGECLERFDAKIRGKPHALAGLSASFRLVSWTHASSWMRTRSWHPISRAGSWRSDRSNISAAQAYIGTMNEWDNWLTRLAGVLARCRYEFTYVLREMAGLNCPLTGNGMCIGARLLEVSGWQAFFSDRELGTVRTVYRRGHPNPFWPPTPSCSRSKCAQCDRGRFSACGGRRDVRGRSASGAQESCTARARHC